MEARVVSRTVKYGEQHWEKHADGSFHALAFGFFSPRDKTPRYGYIPIAADKVPDKVKEALQ